MYYFLLEKDVPASLKSYIVIYADLAFEERTRSEAFCTTVGSTSSPAGFYLEDNKKYYYLEVEEDEPDAQKLSKLSEYIKNNYPSTIYLFHMEFDYEGLGVIDCNLGNGGFEHYTLDHHETPVFTVNQLAGEVKDLLTMDADELVKKMAEIHRYLEKTTEIFSQGVFAMFESSLEDNNTRGLNIKEVLQSLESGAITEEDAIRMISSINSEGGK